MRIRFRAKVVFINRGGKFHLSLTLYLAKIIRPVVHKVRAINMLDIVSIARILVTGDLLKEGERMVNIADRVESIRKMKERLQELKISLRRADRNIYFSIL